MCIGNAEAEREFQSQDVKGKKQSLHRPIREVQIFTCVKKPHSGERDATHPLSRTAMKVVRKKGKR
ncbi:hypothetical protein SK128_011607 [Halocaridina rubra]|uniref:Uncharacterized protein n=1 Tax=Halocaridina rubra TaxID=373956 RepID=A0AAN8ZVB4_HALRR